MMCGHEVNEILAGATPSRQELPERHQMSNELLINKPPKKVEVDREIRFRRILSLSLSNQASDVISSSV